MTFPVFRAFFASLAYLVTHFLTVLKILWLPALLFVAAMAYLSPGMLDAQMQMAAAGESDDPSEAFRMMGPMMRAAGLLYLASAILYPIMTAGVLRHVVRGETPGLPFYLQFGGDELRVLAAFVLLIIMFGLVYVVGVLAVLVLGIGLSALSPAIGGAVMAVLVVAFICILIWFMVRLSVVFAAGVGARSVGIVESWRLAKGNFWGLFFYWIFWVIVVTIVAGLYFAIAAGDYFGLFFEMFAAAQDPEAMREIERRMLQVQRDLWDMSSPGFWPYVIATYLYMMIHTAIWTVAGGVAYRYLSEDG